MKGSGAAMCAQQKDQSWIGQCPFEPPGSSATTLKAGHTTRQPWRLQTSEPLLAGCVGPPVLPREAEGFQGRSGGSRLWGLETEAGKATA